MHYVIYLANIDLERKCTEYYPLKIIVCAIMANLTTIIIPYIWVPLADELLHEVHGIEN